MGSIPLHFNDVERLRILQQELSDIIDFQLQACNTRVSEHQVTRVYVVEERRIRGVEELMKDNRRVSELSFAAHHPCVLLPPLIPYPSFVSFESWIAPLTMQWMVVV
eukprot:330479-Hanusia_phi.AAC.1